MKTENSVKKDWFHNLDVWSKLKVYLHHCILGYELKYTSIHWIDYEPMSFDEFFSISPTNPNHYTAWEWYLRFEKDIIL